MKLIKIFLDLFNQNEWSMLMAGIGIGSLAVAFTDLIDPRPYPIWWFVVMIIVPAYLMLKVNKKKVKE